MQKSKVYVRLDDSNRILSVDGGRTESNIQDFSEWVLIDEGSGIKYDFCQNNYLEKPIKDERGIYRYKLVDGKPVERTQEEMDADYVPPVSQPTDKERIAALEEENAVLLECLLEMSEVVYA